MSIKLQTDQSGANNNICTGTSATFNFSLASNNTLDQADFVIKKGSGTTASIVVTIYNQPNGGGSVVSSSTVLAANVTQSFSTIVFAFSSVSLTAGTSYSAVLSSSTSCSGNNPYSFKSGNFQIIDSGGGVINTGYGIDANVNSASSLSCSTNLSALISSSINNAATASVLITLNKANNNHIKIDGAGIPTKLYLGNTRRKAYHKGKMIMDNNG